MKKTTIFRITTVLVGMAITIGITRAQAPATLTAEGTALVKDSTNSALVKTPAEYIDSLTIGAANVKYLVYPDLKASPLYNFTTNATANLNSTFTWSSVPAAGVTINNAIAGFATNYAKITFPITAGDYTISTTETAISGTCAGTPVTLAARLIAVPAVTGGTVTGAITCPVSDVPYGLNVPTIKLTGVSTAVVNNGSQKLRITYTLTGPIDNYGTLGTIGTANTVLGITEGTATPTLDLSALNGDVNFPGTYTFHVSAISDRISRKSAVTVAPVFTDVTFTINRRPVTGPIYHVPNM